MQRRVADGIVTPYPKTERSRRRVPLTAQGARRLPAASRPAGHGARLPGPQGGYLSLDNFRTREWYDALDAAGIERRGPYHLRHTFATEALAAGVSIFELSRVMGASVKEIDRTYGHLARDSEDTIRARLDARSDRSGVFLASAEGDDVAPETRKPPVTQAVSRTGATGLEPATSGVTGRRSNQLNYAPRGDGQCSRDAQ